MPTITWVRQTGSEIETNDLKATIEHCEAQGWKRKKGLVEKIIGDEPKAKKKPGRPKKEN